MSDRQKEAYDQTMAFLETVAKNHPDVIIGCVAGELANGKYLVLPPQIYIPIVQLFIDKGYGENVTNNIYESKPIQYTTEPLQKGKHYNDIRIPKRRRP